MGVAIISGVIASLESRSVAPGFQLHPKWESHTSGTSTPVGAPDDTIPSRFIACVSREESAKQLRKIFPSGRSTFPVDIVVAKNVAAVQQSDVILLW